MYEQFWSKSSSIAANATTLPNALIKPEHLSDLVQLGRTSSTHSAVLSDHGLYAPVIYSIISHDCAFYLPAAKLGSNELKKQRPKGWRFPGPFCMFHERCTHDTYWNYAEEIQTCAGNFLRNDSRWYESRRAPERAREREREMLSEPGFRLNRASDAGCPCC